MRHIYVAKASATTTSTTTTTGGNAIGIMALLLRATRLSQRRCVSVRLLSSSSPPSAAPNAVNDPKTYQRGPEEIRLVAHTNGESEVSEYPLVFFGSSLSLPKTK